MQCVRTRGSNMHASPCMQGPAAPAANYSSQSSCAPATQGAGRLGDRPCAGAKPMPEPACLLPAAAAARRNKPPWQPRQPSGAAGASRRTCCCGVSSRVPSLLSSLKRPGVPHQGTLLQAQKQGSAPARSPQRHPPPCWPWPLYLWLIATREGLLPRHGWAQVRPRHLQQRLKRACQPPLAAACLLAGSLLAGAQHK
jgi:hypothetical protein